MSALQEYHSLFLIVNTLFLIFWAFFYPFFFTSKYSVFNNLYINICHTFFTLFLALSYIIEGGEYKMTFSNCETKMNCTGIAVITSLILGIITAFLQITGVITIAPVLLQSAIIIALVFLLAVLIAVSLMQACDSCRSLCSVLSVLLLGILGSILFAIILLITGITATSVVSAILVGLLVFFFALLILATACLIKCIANCND